MPNFYKKIRKNSKNNKINALQIKIIARRFHLEEKAGALIAELKGGELISPFLPANPKSYFPVYEINPSLRDFPNFRLNLNFRFKIVPNLGRFFLKV